MVDTHKPSLTVEPRLLNKVKRVVVIDHHRRGEEFVRDPVLVYLESYASSTSELVTELLQSRGTASPSTLWKPPPSSPGWWSTRAISWSARVPAPLRRLPS